MISGCATTEYQPVVPAGKPAEPKKEGAYHTVQKGQTLWRISKAYGVSTKDIVRDNNIPNAAAIEVGQLIFIPGVQEAKEIAAYTPDENRDEFAWPIKGKVIRYFNDANGLAVSRGIDILAQEGDAIKASREGTVVMADYLNGYGQTILLDHGDGFISVYAQNLDLLVKLGDHVYKGNPIARVGKSGRRAFEHFEVRQGTQAVNPLYYLP